MRKIQVGCLKIGEEERKEINEVLDSSRISEGVKVHAFEKEWANFIGQKYCVTFNSGTSAAISGLLALKHKHSIKDSAKVITTPLTYISTTNSIIHSKLQPVYVDVDRETFGITPENIKSFLDEEEPSDCAIILPVHLMGYPVDMDKINKIAKQKGLIVVEDSAQAHGTLYHGKKTGSMSALSIFSFYVAHNIQAGEMGAIVTDNEEIATLAKRIKSNGRMCSCAICTREQECRFLNDNFDPRFTHDIIGYNFKTMEFPAAIALAQMKKIDEIIKKRQENVKYLNENLEKYSDVLQLPKYSKDISYLAYPLVIKKPEEINREKLLFKLEKKGVEARPLFGSIPTQQKAYQHLSEKYKNKLINADYLGSNAFYIGCHQHLIQEDLDYIIKTFGGVL
jgi:dTDP-4-amino-4,6-dideoxygalactose transaminase